MIIDTQKDLNRWREEDRRRAAASAQELQNLAKEIEEEMRRIAASYEAEKTLRARAEEERDWALLRAEAAEARLREIQLNKEAGYEG